MGRKFGKIWDDQKVVKIDRGYHYHEIITITDRYYYYYDNLYLIVSDSSKDHAATVLVYFWIDKLSCLGDYYAATMVICQIFYPHEWILLHTSW